MTSVEIALESDGTDGRYAITLDDGSEAEMTYRMTSEEVMAINHTFVPRPFRGGQFAENLVNRGVADARANGWKILPVCSYVAAQFRRHPEWHDLLADQGV